MAVFFWRMWSLEICVFTVEVPWNSYKHCCLHFHQVENCRKPIVASVNKHHHQRESAENTRYSSRFNLLFKDQKSACFVKTQLKDLSFKLQTTIQPVFASKKVDEELLPCKTKPHLINQHCVMYEFQCNLCNMGNYFGYTCGHLFAHMYKGIRASRHLCTSIMQVNIPVKSQEIYLIASKC